MMSQKVFSALIVLVAICLPFSTVGQNQVQKDKKAITAVSKARADAFNKEDAKGIAKYFTQDALLMAPGKKVSVGRPAVTAYYQSIFDEFEVQLTSHYEEVEVSGDMAYGRGEAIVRSKPHSGGTFTETSSKYLNILKRQPDGSWKTTHDIWNGND